MHFSVGLKNCTVIEERHLTKEKISQIMMQRYIKNFLDIYIIHRGVLAGLISSFDYEKAESEYGDCSLVNLINYNPIKVYLDRTGEADRLFKQHPNVWSIPVVNEDNVLMYVIERLNIRIGNFWKIDHDFLVNYDLIRKRIQEKSQELKHKFPAYAVKIITDLRADEITILGLQDSCLSQDNYKMLEPDKDIALLAFRYNYNAQNTIGMLIESGIKFYGLNITMRSETCHYYENDRSAHYVLRQEALKNGSYFDMNDFENIFQAIKMTENIDGSYLEIGAYRGDSARAALSYMGLNGTKREAYFLDTYEGFSYKEAYVSSDCFWEGTHDHTSIDFVKNRLKEFHNFKLVKTNVITDDLPEEIGNVAVCNIDVDLYEAVYAALSKVHMRMVAGGVILCEDYGHTPLLYGAHYAVEQFLKEYDAFYYAVYLKSGQYMLIKK